jgi:centrosomal protein CEP164
MPTVLDISSFVPTDAEIRDYAAWLGMEFPRHESLLWIAEEGLRAPLPGRWKACKCPKGELYFFDFSTGESIWEHPVDASYKRLFQSKAADLDGELLPIKEPRPA